MEHIQSERPVCIRVLISNCRVASHKVVFSPAQFAICRSFEEAKR